MLFHKKHYYLILAVVIFILFLNQAYSFVPLQGQSFALRATVTQLDVKSTFKVPKSQPIGHSHEKYSNDQKRAVLSFGLQGQGRQTQVGQLFYDSKERQSLKYDHLDKSCKLVLPNEMNLLPNLDISSLELDNSTQSDHVIGLARLVLFVEYHKEKLKMVGEPLEKRNMVSLEYSYSFDEVQLNVYYSSLALCTDANALPTQIIVSSKQQIYIVDYSRISKFSSTEQEIGNPDGIYVDEFAFPRECANQLRNKWEKGLISASEFGQFSFQTKITFADKLIPSAKPSPSFQPKVSYYHSLDSLSIRYSNELEGSNLINTRKVVNFRFKRAYQAMEYGVGEELKRKCFVFKISNLGREKQTVSETLIGANFLIYLGLAEVRGISTRLYVALDGTIPLWVEQPVEYSSKGSTKIRDPLLGMGLTKETLTTLVYVANDDKVVQIELIKSKYRVVVEVFNFKWASDPVESTDDLFSLRLACANTNGIKHAKVEMLLIKLDGQQFKKRPERSRLELNVLKTIQEDMSVPVTMVYDLETKLINMRDFFVSFHVASHTDNIVSLTYLGKGKMKVGQREEILLIAYSFQTCFQLASRQPKTKVFFGYNTRDKKCCIVSGTGDIEFKEFEETSGKLMEFYTAEHEQTRVIIVDSEGINGRWLEDSGREIYRRSLIGVRIHLDIPGPTEPLSWYQIKRLMVKTLSGQEIGLPYIIHGVKLLENSQNRRFENLKSHVTLPECRSSCFSSDTCQSFSVCQNPQGLECILSPSNFRSEAILKQLRSEEMSSKKGKILNVTLDDGNQVKLLRRLNCDLYNKLYMDDFVPYGQELQSIGEKQQLMLSKDKEDCAKICVQLNLQVLNQDVSITSKMNSLLSSRTSVEQRKELENLFKQRKEITDRLCTGFLYLDFSKVYEDEEKLAAKFKLNTEDLKSFTGYCSLEVEQQADVTKRPQAIVDDVRFVYAKYRFRWVNFYTSQKGVHLLASELSTDDKMAFAEAKQHSTELTQANYDRLRKLLELGNNFQEVFVLYGTERNCAERCFFSGLGRAYGTWPMCKSFDVLRNDRLGQKVCYLNSVSLEEAVVTDLIDDKSNSSNWIEWSHYEPSFLISQNIDSLSEAKLEVDESNWFMTEHPRIINGFFLFIFGWLAIVGGLFLGVKVGQRLIINQNGLEPESAEIAKFDFVNQVDEHGVSVD